MKDKITVNFSKPIKKDFNITYAKSVYDNCDICGRSFNFGERIYSSLGTYLICRNCAEDNEVKDETMP